MIHNEQKLRNLALDHIAAKEEYDSAIHKYQNSYVHVENPERYADVQVALVEVEARLRILKAHVEEMVVARVSELIEQSEQVGFDA